jgi:FAD/FMN-containing dehydrogenase
LPSQERSPDAQAHTGKYRSQTKVPAVSIPAVLIRRLREISGPGGALDDPQLIEPYLVDHRRSYRGATAVVLKPDTTERVISIMRMCHEHGIGVVPVGGNTGYCGGATPSADGSQVVLSLSRLRRIRALDPFNYALTVEAGCTLAEVQAAAARMQRFFPLSLGSEGTCQIGGNLSTNAGGTGVLRYGLARDLCLRLEVVLPDGQLVDELSRLRKNNTGYSIRDLFIGAEGTLGVITAAVMRVFPQPVGMVTAIAAIPDPTAAVDLLAHLRSQTGDGVSAFELMSRVALELVLQHIPNVSDPLGDRSDWYALVEATTTRSDPAWMSVVEAALASAVEQGLVKDAAVAQSIAHRAQFWRIRETIAEAQAREGANLKHDVSVTTTQLPEFIREGDRLMQELIPGLRPVVFGHLGDGNLHFNANAPLGGDPAEFRAQGPIVQRAIHDLAAKYRGSFSAEHGIGQLKIGELERYKNPVSLDLMRLIKRAIDPKGIMNPGKVIAFN